MSAARVALRERFGLEAFRPYQEEALRAVLEGRDVVLTLPTGHGKSLVYQLPAVVLEGLTLVVSPLIALMEDQVAALQARGLRAAALHSLQEGRVRAATLDKARAGAFDLLYVTPERFRVEAFVAAIADLGVVRLVVDEAHCIAAWGHDFRPDYSRLGEYRRLLGDVPTLASTATATLRVVDEIVTSLRLSNPHIVRAGIERPELFFAVREVEDREQRIEALVERCRSIDGPGIVYTALIKDLEELHVEFARRGLETLVYHGKLGADERRAMQERFTKSERSVVLATNAFGMGIDKSDIRFVLHAQIPRTLEAWTQEVGRAGRDGAPSLCELYYFEEDLAIQQSFVDWANPSLEYLLLVYETLHSWGERVQTKDLDDLRSELLVKNRHDNRVAICLRWLEVLGAVEGSFEQHDLRVVRDFDARELPAWLATGEKRDHDLRALLEMLRFAKQRDRCRRVVLAEHFGLAREETLESQFPCGRCDVCASTEDFVRTTFSERASALVEARDEDARFARGDWVVVDGRHRGQVLRVEGRGRRLRLLVQDARDLETRLVDPRRQRVRRLDEA